MLGFFLTEMLGFFSHRDACFCFSRRCLFFVSRRDIRRNREFFGEVAYVVKWLMGWHLGLVAIGQDGQPLNPPSVP